MSKLAVCMVSTNSMIIPLDIDSRVKRARADWSTGLFECAQVDGGCAFCCLAAVLPCAAYGINYSHLVRGQPEDCISPCVLYAAVEILVSAAQGSRALSNRGGGGDLSMLYALLVFQQRLALGESIGIPTGDCCNLCVSWCEVFWCTPCVQAQIRNEMVLNWKNIHLRPKQSFCCQCLCCLDDCGCAGCVEVI